MPCLPGKNKNNDYFKYCPYQLYSPYCKKETIVTVVYL